MSIPAFNGHGLLPEGLYVCDLEELRIRFVDGFPLSTTRTSICDKFARWLGKLAMLLPAGTQWVDGSYVTIKTDPEDIDVVTFCDGIFLDALTPAIEDQIEIHANGQEDTVPEYGTHSILIGVYPKGHPGYPLYAAERSYFRKWWGEFYPPKDTTDGPPAGEPKGYLQMVFGDPNRVPDVNK